MAVHLGGGLYTAQVRSGGGRTFRLGCVIDTTDGRLTRRFGDSKGISAAVCIDPFGCVPRIVRSLSPVDQD